MMTKVYAHKGTGIDCKLAGGVTITAPAGGYWEGNLTGDQYGKIDAYLMAQTMKMPDHLCGGKVVCPDRDEEPPKGSKAHRILHPELYKVKTAKVDAKASVVQNATADEKVKA